MGSEGVVGVENLTESEAYVCVNKSERVETGRGTIYGNTMYSFCKESSSHCTKREMAFTGIVLFSAMVVMLVITREVVHAPASHVPDVPEEVASTEPARTDFDGVPPEGFPTDFPIGKGEAVSESYSLAYPTGKQMTYVYTVPKQPKEAFHELESYFAKQGYVAINSYKTEKLLTLYVRQGSMDVNMVVEGYDTSKVTLSVLKNN